jgi:hypothetical protein
MCHVHSEPVDVTKKHVWISNQLKIIFRAFVLERIACI